MIDRSLVMTLVDYDATTGFFRSKRTGKKVGGKSSGYQILMLDGHKYYAHRVAWLIITGDFPPGGIDHRDLNRSNNAFSNLRLASASENGSNCARRANNKSGFKGVYRDGNRFRAQITIAGKCQKLGDFTNAEDAHAAYLAAAKSAFGEFARAA